MELLAETSNPQGFKRFKEAHENKDDNKKINKGFIKKETKETKDKKETKDSPSDRPKVLTTEDIQRKYHERIQREKEEKERLKRIKPKKINTVDSTKKVWTISEIKKKNEQERKRNEATKPKPAN